jgi:transaldolase
LACTAFGIDRQYYKALSYTGSLSASWQRAFNEGALPQRLLWASTGTKDPGESDTLYVKNLATPFTVSTKPEATLKAFADHGEVA